MIIDEHLYIGTMPEKTASRLLKKIKNFKSFSGAFVVTFPLFDDGLLEIYDVNEFRQEYYKRRSDDIHIVGISQTRKGAFYLVRDIMDDVYAKTGTCDCVNYFKNIL